MFRFAAPSAVAVLSAALILGACTRTPPNQSLKTAHSGADATAASVDSGSVTPGSMQEFATRARDTVYFATNSTVLSPTSQQTLIAQSRWLNRYSQYAIVVEGHADERGTREYNLALGARRAAAVRHFLVARGVDPRRIRTISYGKERPVAVCSNISCWARNRRAVTVLSQYRSASEY